MASQSNLTPSATNFIIIAQGNTVTDATANTCTYTLEYSTDGINWTTYSTYTDQVSNVIQPEPTATSGTGGSSGETRLLPF